MIFEWKFENLPSGMKDEVIDLINSGNSKELLKIHNEYKLSSHSYCCGESDKQLIRWFKWGIKKNKIK